MKLFCLIVRGTADDNFADKINTEHEYSNAFEMNVVDSMVLVGQGIKKVTNMYEEIVNNCKVCHFSGFLEHPKLVVHFVFLQSS